MPIPFDSTEAIRRASDGDPVPIDLFGKCRILVRSAMLLAVLLIIVPLHYLFRLIRYGSPFPMVFLRIATRAIGARVRVHGVPLRRDVFFMPNHVSWFDIPALGGVTGSAFVARAEIAEMRVLGWMARLNRTVFTQRQDRMNVAEQINALRRQSAPCATAGAAMQRLSWETRLAASAQEQATDLAVQDRLSHLDSRNRGLGVRLRSVGYAAAGAGENLAAGQSDIEDALQAWLASPSHCANLMQPEYRDVGLACVQRRGSRYERFWVAHFGVPATTLRR